jgi:type III pantothenate kinase
MRSGFAFGTAAMIDGVIDRMQKEFDRKLTVVLTGKTAEMITPYCEREVVLDKNLLLKGLRIIYLKNLHHKGSR